MHIANPIYDVIFKYMLEDNKVAKLFLSAIIEEEITELEFSAQERTTEVKYPAKERAPISVCRYDFTAKIKTNTGFKTVNIELQKAKFVSDLLRFRRYLGLQYQNSDNIFVDTVGEQSLEEQYKVRQIYCIYFLYYGVDLPKRPVLKVDYKMQDPFTGDEFPAIGEFVSGLHHRSWIVQIRELNEKHRNDLEKLLSIFDQNQLTETRFILDVDDENFPEAYQYIIRRLRKAMEDPNQKRAMELEEDIINELKDRERLIEAKTNLIAEKDQTIAHKDKTISELEKKLAEINKNNLY